MADIFPRRPVAALLALCLGGGLALGGCGGTDDAADGTVTLTFWDNNGGPTRTPLWEHIIAEFQQANPTIRVKYVGIPIAQAQQKYNTAVAAGGLPDVGGVSTAYVAELAAQKALVPLDDLVAGSPELNGKLVPGFVETLRNTVPDNKLYIVPQTGNMDTIWYRKDWFTKEGVAAPATWDAFFAAARKLTDSSRNRYGFTIRGGAGSSFQFIAEMYAYSGITTIFDEAGKSTVDDPRNVEALKKIVALYDKQTPKADVNNDFPKMVAQFVGGSIGMMHHNLGSYQDHVKAFGADNVGFAPLPPSPATGTYTIASNPVGGVAVFASGKHRDAARRFAAFVGSAAQNSYWTRNTGELPANTAVRDEAWISETPAGKALAILSDPKTKVVPLPYFLPEFNANVKADLEPIYQKVLLGQETVENFLARLASMLNEAHAKWRARQK